MAGTGKPTMADVARDAGVSTATVSRVLRGEEGVSSTATRERVFASAAELGYIVNSVASSMRRRRTGTIGLVMADVANPWFGQLAGSVESALGSAGISVILANTSNSEQRERVAVQTLLQKQVDALIVATSSADGSHLREAVSRGTTVVLVDADLPDLAVDSVTIDNVAAARTAVDHLLDFGHHDVAIVMGGSGPASDRARLEGYRQALTARDLHVPHEYICSGADTFEGGRAAAASVLEQWRRPTAFFATNNYMTMGTLVAIAEAGLKVPADVSVVGIDDMEWYPIADPPITAVHESASEMGRLAAERLLLRLRRKRQPPPERIRLETEFRIRDSVGPPPDDPGHGHREEAG